MKKNLLKLISVILCLAMILSASAVIGSAEGESETPAIGEFEPFRITVTANGDTKTQKGFCWYTVSNTDSVVKLYDANGAEVTDAEITYSDVLSGRAILSIRLLSPPSSPAPSISTPSAVQTESAKKALSSPMTATISLNSSQLRISRRAAMRISQRAPKPSERVSRPCPALSL